MNYLPKLDRRSFLVGSATVGLSVRLPCATHVFDERAGRARNQRMGRDQAGRHRRRPHRTFGNGPGDAHRPRPDGRRGARMRLVESDDRISDARRERCTQESLGRFRHRRQPRYPHLTGLCAQRRRGGAHDADLGRRKRMEGARFRVHRGQRRDHPQGVEPFDDLWQSRRRCGADRAAQGGAAQGSEGLEDHRQERQASRHRRQDRRQDDVRRRRKAAGHAQRGDQGLSGVWRQAEELRRRQSRVDEGRQESRAGRRLCRCCRRRYLVARQDCARCAADRLGPRRKCEGIE